jgi:hypothetical protein
MLDSNISSNPLYCCHILLLRDDTTVKKIKKKANVFRYMPEVALGVPRG